MSKEVKEEAKNAVVEVLEEAHLRGGDIFVVGCSTSEIIGEHIGKRSNMDEAMDVFDAIKKELDGRNIFLAAQCCEHLNRAIVIERKAVGDDVEIVNAVPQIHAGGSFATICYERFEDPIVLEEIKADAGMDIGDTFIGMHLKKVAVPIRISTKKIGKANVTAARTRPKFIGGYRAKYSSFLAKGRELYDGEVLK